MRAARVAVAITLGLALLALAPTEQARAQPPDPYARLFPFEADVEIDQPGAYLVPLDADVLSEARPGLDNLRLVARDGTEVPWLVEGDVPERPTWVDVPLLPLHVARSEEWPLVAREAFVVELPELPHGVDSWDVDLRSAVPEHVERVIVEALEQDGRPSRILYEGSIFRLLAPLRERTRVPLAAPPGPVRITLESNEARNLAPDVHAVAARPRVAPEELSIELAIDSVRHGDGRTIVRLARPRGVVPPLLRIDASDPTFHRPIVVRDVGPGSERTVLARAAIWRVAELHRAAELDVPLARARGEALELELVDGDTPPLDGLVVRAIVPRPMLVADLPGPVTLRYGGGRAHPPSYDFTGLVPGGEARRLLEREIPIARVSTPRRCPYYEPAPALGFAMRSGAAVELHRFTHARAVQIEDAPEGLARIRLTPAEIAHARADLGDLRVVDSESRQWPYLLERAADVAHVSVAPSTSRDGMLSRFVVLLRDSPLPVTAIELASAEPYIDCDYVVRGRLGDGWRVLATGRLTRRPDRDDALRIDLRVAGAASRVDELAVEVRDGGDAPLAVSNAVVDVEVADLYVAAPHGRYRLLVGDPTAEAPEYELARARGLALSVAATDVRPEQLLPNPDWLPERDTVAIAEIFLFVALAIAVLFLGWLSLRLARSEGTGADEDASAAARAGRGEAPAPEGGETPPAA